MLFYVYFYFYPSTQTFNSIRLSLKNFCAFSKACCSVTFSANVAEVNTKVNNKINSFLSLMICINLAFDTKKAQVSVS